MSRILECVPNFSEGRDPAVLAAIRGAIAGAPGVALLDDSSDWDHHRSVFTFAGEPGAVVDALLAAASAAIPRIDLRRHRGGHPRMGALDVAPFVPLRGVSWDEAVEAARRCGERLWRELGAPVYFYGKAALDPRREALEQVRRGGFEALLAAALEDPGRAPDIGGPNLHPAAGAVAVGVRKPLIAYNINLRPPDLAAARSLARAVRASSGGFPAVKALGIPLPKRDLVQVSMNLTDYEITPPQTVYDQVRQLAAGAGVEVAGAELIGLLPSRALPPGGPGRIGLAGAAEELTIEGRLAAAGFES